MHTDDIDSDGRSASQCLGALDTTASRRSVRKQFAAATAVALALSLSSCGDKDEAAPAASPSASAVAEVAKTRQFSAFEIVGTFNGTVVGARGDTVVTLGDGTESLGSTLTGLTTYSPSGVKRAELTPVETPCGYAVAGSDDVRIVTIEAKGLSAQGTVEAGWQHTIRIYDSELNELKSIELAEVRGPGREMWLDEPSKGSCELQASADGRWVVGYDAKGWLLVDTDKLTAEPILDHYQRDDDKLPSRVVPLGEQIVIAPSRAMLAELEPSVVDAETNATIMSFPVYDPSAAAGSPEASDAAALAERVLDRKVVVDPKHQAAVYYWWDWRENGSSESAWF